MKNNTKKFICKWCGSVFFGPTQGRGRRHGRGYNIMDKYMGIHCSANCALTVGKINSRYHHINKVLTIREGKNNKLKSDRQE